MLAWGLEAGLSPSELVELTPREIIAVYRAYRERSLDLQEMLAWTQANILNAWSKKTVKVRHLFRRPKRHWEVGSGG